MRGRHDQASSYNGTVLSSEFPAGKHTEIMKMLHNAVKLRRFLDAEVLFFTCRNTVWCSNTV